MNHTVLVVDDTAETRDYVEDVLNKKCNIIKAKNGSEALDLYLKHKPDTVLLDIAMPVMDGIEALSRLQKLDKDARVVMLSALEDDAVIDECLKKGASAFITKPFTKNELLNTLNNLSRIGQKYYTTLFAKTTNKLYRSLNKLDPDTSILLLDVDVQKQETSPQGYSPEADFSRLKTVTRIISELKISPPSDMKGFVTEFHGVQSGFVSSFIDEKQLVDFVQAAKIDTHLEFFNMFNNKIISELSNSIDTSLRPYPTRIFDGGKDGQILFDTIVKAQFKISCKGSVTKIIIETHLCLEK